MRDGLAPLDVRHIPGFLGQFLMLVGPGSVLVGLVVFDETTMLASCPARSSAVNRGCTVAAVDLVGLVALLERAADAEAGRCQGAAVAVFALCRLVLRADRFGHAVANVRPGDQVLDLVSHDRARFVEVHEQLGHAVE
jgi:hypothetical protein